MHGDVDEALLRSHRAMTVFLDLAAVNIFDARSLLTAFGVAGIFVVLFAETGLLVGFFLPGDSLLFTAGLLASSNTIHVPVWLVIVVAFAAAAMGDQVGYFLGHRFGRRLFKPDARILKTRRLDEAEKFFAKYGGASLILGRFVPVVRTYVPLAAGTAEYRYRKFLAWNLSGAALWTVSVTILGVLLGGIAFVRNNIDVIAIAIVIVSILPIAVSVVVRVRKNRGARNESDTPNNR
jgi:membrane-associated protein